MDFEFAQKISVTYTAFCKALCKEIKMPQTAFDILLFLANNPAYTSARDIVEIRKINASLVSINVDKLVREGLLERRAVPGDRRKTTLSCTEKAMPIVARGRALQQQFIALLFENIPTSEQALFHHTVKTMEQNLDAYLKEAD